MHVSVVLNEHMVCRRFGNSVFLQFVDMNYGTASELVNVYRSDFPCMHDGSYGRAATILAGNMLWTPEA